MIKTLTKVSNQNINNIFENYSQYLNYDIKNKGFIKILYDLIRSYKYKKEVFNVIIDKPIINASDSPYMAPNILQFIKTQTFYNYGTQFLMDNTNIILNVYSISKIDIQKYLFYIKLVLHICINTTTKKHNELKFKILLTDYIKICPTIPVEAKHVNSGQTDPNINEIMIYRKEEWFKVYIHECIHLFELDFCTTNMDYKSMFKQLYNVESDFLFFEAYTEYWARTINLSIVSYYATNKISQKDFENIVTINIQVERLYCIAQMNHLLYKMGLTYEDLFRQLILRENTNFFCYYVLTSVLFYNYDDSMGWFLQNNGGIQFAKQNIVPFFEFIKQRHRTPEFLSFIKKMNKPLHNCNMSAFDIQF
jgi:hypothetical protein